MRAEAGTRAADCTSCDDCSGVDASGSDVRPRGASAERRAGSRALNPESVVRVPGTVSR